MSFISNENSSVGKKCIIITARALMFYIAILIRSQAENVSY